MRSGNVRSIVAMLVVVTCSTPPVTAAADDVKGVTVRVNIRTATSLRVSSSLLRFDVSDPASPATVEIQFAAGGRTYKGGDVVLTVEAAGTVETPDGVRSQDLAIGYEGEGQAGTLAAAAPSTAGRWMGSGFRQGRVLFTLRGATVPGTYQLPVKFALSTP